MSAKSLPAFVTRLGDLTAHPAAFVIVGVYALGWLIFEPGTFDWHAGATLATWVMTLFIQRSEHRSNLAVHAKLDEVIRAQGGARDHITEMDTSEVEEIEAHREHEAGHAL